MRRILSLALVLIAAASAAFAETDPVLVASPDGQLELRLFIVSPKDAILVRLAYSVSFRGKLLIEASLMGMALRDQEVILGETVGLVSAPPEVNDRYNSVIAQYIQNGSLGRRVTVEARAYNEGVAFRYHVPRTSTVEDFQVEEELTDFHFAQDGDVYAAVLSDYQSKKGEYRRMKLSGIQRNSLLALPLLVEQPGAGWVAITQAQVENFPGMYLFHAEGTTIRTTLSPRLEDAAIVMRGVTPADTPWRVLLVAAEPRKLLDSDIISNLNPRPAIADTSWTKAPREFVPLSYSEELDRQLDAELAKLERTGATGVKIDLLNRTDQRMIDFYRRAARTAANHHLMIQFENAPLDGIERTWPNVLPRDDPEFRRLIESL